MWDTKYRPLKFSDVLGQEGSVKLLKARLKHGTAFDTSYIFAGGYGRGKTTLSRILARAMLCLNLDKSDPEPCNVCDNCRGILDDQPGAFSERDAASRGTVDDMKELVKELPFVIVNAPRRIYLFDEAHRMSLAAQDVLLKPVEEKQMVGIFCTTEAEKIRGAIRSRCEEYTIRKITRDDILKRMQIILAAENVEFQDDAVLIVIDHCGGHARDVINRLEMVSQLGPVTVENVREYLRLGVVSLYYEILLHLDSPQKAIALVDRACDQASPEDVSAGIAEAAMNSYRVANNMHADFSYVDKTLAEKVYGKYQANIVKFAYWFLGSKYTTKLSLVRDVVVFSQTPGNLPVEGPTPPIVFTSNMVQVSAAAPVNPSPVPVPVSTPLVQTVPVASEPVASKPAYTDFRDPTPPTATEEPLVNAPLPRSRGKTAGISHRSGSISKKPMTPDEWRVSFERLWRKKQLPTLP